MEGNEGGKGNSKARGRAIPAVMREGRPRTAAVLVLFTALFTLLTMLGIMRTSATWDEPQHLTSGLMASILHDYRVDPEHPPLLRIWAALPLQARAGIRPDTRGLDAIDPGQWAKAGQFLFAHEYLYRAHDADQLLVPARFMIVLLGILLGILLFLWARSLFGFRIAAATLGFYMLEPNILAHSSLVTTDLGVTLFFFGAIYFLWRASREITLANAAGFAAFFALAQVSKFSALLLGPVACILLAIRAIDQKPWACGIGRRRLFSTRLRRAAAAGAMLGLALAASWVAIWAAYSFRYAPSPSGSWLFGFSADPEICRRVPLAARIAGWVDAHRLLPNAYTQGFLLGQSSAHTRGAFLAGRYSETGWWSYFPVAFLLKTPTVLILLFAGGIAMLWRRREAWGGAWTFPVVPIVVYMGVAMSARLNIGLRHILPIYPFVLLVAGSAVAALPRKRLAVISCTIFAAWLVEFTMAAPHYLAFFNLAAGGPKNGHRYLVDSNLDWGQDLKGLKRWMDQNGVRQINLSYFGTADPAYYGIDAVPLPGAPFFDRARIAPPKLPGYVVVSATNLHGPHLGESGAALFRPLLSMKPVAVIGHSIHIYRLER